MLRSQKTAALAGVLLFCLPLAGGAEARQKIGPERDGTPLSPLDKQHFLNDNFTIVKTVSELPQGVQEQIANVGTEGKVADASHLSHAISVPFEPLRRLILAGTSAGYCFVYARYGSFGSWPDVSLYRLSDKNATLIWCGYEYGLDQTISISDLPQLRNAIRNDKLTNAKLPTQPQGSH